MIMYLIQFFDDGLITKEGLFHRVENARGFYIDLVLEKKLVELEHPKSEYLIDHNKMIDLYEQVDLQLKEGCSGKELTLTELEPMDLPASANKSPDMVQKNAKHRPFTKGYKILRPNRNDKEDVPNVFTVFECRCTGLKAYKLKDGNIYTFFINEDHTGTLQSCIDFLQKCF